MLACCRACPAAGQPHGPEGAQPVLGWDSDSGFVCISECEGPPAPLEGPAQVRLALHSPAELLLHSPSALAGQELLLLHWDVGDPGLWGTLGSGAAVPPVQW